MKKLTKVRVPTYTTLVATKAKDGYVVVITESVAMEGFDDLMEVIEELGMVVQNISLQGNVYAISKKLSTK